MASVLKLRRGNRIQNNVFTGAEGELSYDSTAKKIRAHDGITLGGKILASEIVSVKDFGAVGDGVTDDTAAIQAALAENSNVEVPIGAYLISSTIDVPAYKKLKFQGGTANLGAPHTPPPARLVKKATMTTAGVTLQQCAVMTGGGVVGLAGNTGDGIQLIGNAAILRNSYVSGAGGVGVRVGRSDTVYANVNSTKVADVNSRDNGSHGFYVHDNSTQSATMASADANAGSLINCTAIGNGGDGIKIGRGWWVTIVNALTEENSGWGLNISSTVTVPDTVAEARYTNVFGGDFNEGNTLGSLNIAGYGSSVHFSDTNQAQSLTGVFASLFGAAGSNLYSLIVRNGGLTVSGGGSGSVIYPVNITSNAINNNAAGRGLLFSETYSVTPRSAGAITSYQADSNQDSMGLSVNYNGVLQEFLKLNPNARSVTPYGDNGLYLGHPSARWATVFAGTGAINTSDAREKQQIRSLSDQEKSVAVRLKSMIKAFKFNDAVEAKGDKARIHVGVIAQEVRSAFEAEGLCAESYAVLCYDEWSDEYAPDFERVVTTLDGNEVVSYEDTGKQKLIKAAGNRYGVRYDELFAFIIGAM